MNKVLFTHSFRSDFDTRWEIERGLGDQTQVVNDDWWSRNELAHETVLDGKSHVVWLIDLDQLFEDKRKEEIFFSLFERITDANADLTVILLAASPSDADAVPLPLRTRGYLVDRKAHENWKEIVERICQESFARDDLHAQDEQRAFYEREEQERRDRMLFLSYRLRQASFVFIALFVLGLLALYFIPHYYDLQEHGALLNSPNQNPDLIRLSFEQQRVAGESAVLATVFASLIGTLVTLLLGLRTDRRGTQTDRLLQRQMELTIEKLELEVKALKDPGTDDSSISELRDANNFKELPGEIKLLPPAPTPEKPKTARKRKQ